MTPFPEPPQRRALIDEVHARPYLLLRAPTRLSHLAVLTGEGGQEAERDHLARLCQAFNVPPPPRARPCSPSVSAGSCSAGNGTRNSRPTPSSPTARSSSRSRTRRPRACPPIG